MLPDATSIEQILEDLTEGVYFVDRERRVTFWNRGAERLTGYGRDEVLGKRCSDNMLMHVDAAGTLLCERGCPVHATLHDGERREAEVFLHHKMGQRLPVLVRTVPLRDVVGEVVGVAEIFSDVGERRRMEGRIAELERLAMLDPLTGIANRRYAEVSLSSRLHEWERFGWPFAVLMLDVDFFKEINDALGHDVGDRALRMVAQTLAASARSFDVVGRWGGEEFLALVAGVDAKGMLPVAERFRALVERASLDVATGPVRVTISIGAAAAEPGDTAESILKRADERLYEAKTAGRNRVAG